MAGRNKFVDPRTAFEYPWPINHDAEEQFGKTRNINHSANTENVGLVRQQGDMDPLTIRLTGTILERAQLLQFWAWFNLCETQTIRFQDFEDNIFEVIVSAFQPLRKRVSKNPRDPANAPTHVWTYSIEMDVISVVSGSLEPYL